MVTAGSSMLSLLQDVEAGRLTAADAERLWHLEQESGKSGKMTEDAMKNGSHTSEKEADDVLRSFANLDLRRSERTGFPEAVFADGKTPEQVATILDRMAGHVNSVLSGGEGVETVDTAILATRVTKEQFEAISSIPLVNGTIQYHEMARIVSMRANALDQPSQSSPRGGKRVIVASAGTTDIPVAEEAAVTLEACAGSSAVAGVDRVYDCGVAGLHRIINALPTLRHPDVGCVIVCAGMDGALPSVVAGLVSVPVVAVPTSIGYGAAFGGLSALLTMLNSCAPGVAVVNIENGFGAAALAYKICQSKA